MLRYARTGAGTSESLRIKASRVWKVSARIRKARGQARGFMTAPVGSKEATASQPPSRPLRPRRRRSRLKVPRGCFSVQRPRHQLRRRSRRSSSRSFYKVRLRWSRAGLAPGGRLWSREYGRSGGGGLARHERQHDSAVPSLCGGSGTGRGERSGRYPLRILRCVEAIPLPLSGNPIVVGSLRVRLDGCVPSL